MNDLSIRWLLHRDLPEVLEIERQSFPVGWTEDDFTFALKQQNIVGMVAQDSMRVVGFMLYELRKSQLHVLNFAVAPWVRRQGIGRQMIEKLTHKLSPQRRDAAVVYVSERNITGQLFFRATGFRAEGIARRFYEDTVDDAYVMAYRVGAKSGSVNRVAGLLKGGE